ncbi:nucleolar protein 12 [Podospora didyma]|uniref:Nucleolar protein 12 n=1 Tax=Podospora didyma TaxID=330526 RepID=A0AAE0U8N3_9PEZI|nr:nucleolar protein 12 [Podospora didyma]
MGKSKTGLSAPSKAVDPTLAALFSSSAGPVTAPSKSRYADLSTAKPSNVPASLKKGKAASKSGVSRADDVEEDEELSELSSNAASDFEDISDDEEANDDDDDDDDDELTKVTEAPVVAKRKRKTRDAYDDLEASYLQKLVDDEPSGKRLKADETAETATKGDDEDADSEAEDKANNGEGNDDNDDDDVPSGDEDEEDTPVHESLAADPAPSDIEKANRTVFLSNVSTEAITSRTAKKALMAHLSSCLDKKAVPPQKVHSIRFRSTAFATAGIPKRAAYIKKSVMEATTKSTNAYVVYSSTQAARLAVSQLNGTVVLERHIRVDSVAHPAAVAHRRCVFVGNLGFVDDEIVLTQTIDETTGKEVTGTRKRTKVPMDVEEGLWRIFAKEAGRVESVRVVRDPITRVGKGFAYVQFYDANAVEKAILLTGKKFPPMLPRELRVSRCKAPHKTAKAMDAKYGPKPTDGKGGKFDKNKKSTKYAPKPTAEAQTLAGRAGKLLGRSAAIAHATGSNRVPREQRRPAALGPDAGAITIGGKAIKLPEDIIVFEGRRASEKDGRPKDLKFKQTSSKSRGAKLHKKAAAKTGHGAARAAKWKKAQKAGGAPK